jgi:3-methyladenine DNA glycosylase AlkD
MTKKNIYAEELRRNMVYYSDKAKASWLENYVKHGIISRGIPIPKIRELVQELVQKSMLNEKPQKEQLDFLHDLTSNIHTEDKLAAIIYIQLYWEEYDPSLQLSMISNWFDKKWIFDWNVCDWLCVRVLNRIVNTEPRIAIIELRNWNRNEYLWKARASIVSFIYVNPLTEHSNIISEFSSNLIKRQERFSKTAVGWILREYYKLDEEFVRNFISKNISCFTRETVNNALKYSSKNIRKEFLAKLN